MKTWIVNVFRYWRFCVAVFRQVDEMHPRVLENLVNELEASKVSYRVFLLIWSSRQVVSSFEIGDWHSCWYFSSWICWWCHLQRNFCWCCSLVHFDFSTFQEPHEAKKREEKCWNIFQACFLGFFCDSDFMWNQVQRI